MRPKDINPLPRMIFLKLDRKTRHCKITNTNEQISNDHLALSEKLKRKHPISNSSFPGLGDFREPVKNVGGSVSSTEVVKRFKHFQ